MENTKKNNLKREWDLIKSEIVQPFKNEPEKKPCQIDHKCNLKWLVLIILLAGFYFSSNAQDSQNNISFTEQVYIEADPLAYINKGYSVHLGYENWGWRFDLTKVKVDFPERFENAFYNTSAFDLVTFINGFKIDYIGNRTNWTKGAFIGLDINSQKLNFKHRETGIDKDLFALNIGLRAGYKFNIFRGFYITTWGAIWKNVLTSRTFEVQSDQITTNGFDWITTLHLGYAFKF